MPPLRNERWTLPPPRLASPRLASPRPVSFAAADGYRLNGFAWRHAGPGLERPVVVVNPATSVRCRYYARFAAFLHAHGFDVLCYDYRGIGESRPRSLRGFEAGWIDWGRLDFEAVLQLASERFPGQPVQVVAHSVGGFLIGLAASSHRVVRVFSMGAQYAPWRDYHRARCLCLRLNRRPAHFPSSAAQARRESSGRRRSRRLALHVLTLGFRA